MLIILFVIILFCVIDNGINITVPLRVQVNTRLRPSRRCYQLSRYEVELQKTRELDFCNKYLLQKPDIVEVIKAHMSQGKLFKVVQNQQNLSANVTNLWKVAQTWRNKHIGTIAHFSTNLFQSCLRKLPLYSPKISQTSCSKFHQFHENRSKCITVYWKLNKVRTNACLSSFIVLRQLERQFVSILSNSSHFPSDMFVVVCIHNTTRSLVLTCKVNLFIRWFQVFRNFWIPGVTSLEVLHRTYSPWTKEFYWHVKM